MRILVVDEFRDILHIERGLFQLEGHQPETCIALPAIDFILHSKPDLVVIEPGNTDAYHKEIELLCYTGIPVLIVSFFDEAFHLALRLGLPMVDKFKGSLVSQLIHRVEEISSRTRPPGWNNVFAMK